MSGKLKGRTAWLSLLLLGGQGKNQQMGLGVPLLWRQTPNSCKGHLRGREKAGGRGMCPPLPLNSSPICSLYQLPIPTRLLDPGAPKHTHSEWPRCLYSCWVCLKGTAFNPHGSLTQEHGITGHCLTFIIITMIRYSCQALL